MTHTAQAPQTQQERFEAWYATWYGRGPDYPGMFRKERDGMFSSLRTRRDFELWQSAIEHGAHPHTPNMDPASYPGVTPEKATPTA